MIFKNEDRPDVAIGIDRTVLGGDAVFLAFRIFHPFSVETDGGKLHLAKVVRGTGKKNRAAGSALDGTRVIRQDVSFAVDLFEDRAWFTDSDVKKHGGAEKAVVAGAVSSAFGVIKLIEKEASDTIFTDARYAAAKKSDSSAPFDGLNQAARAVKMYGVPMLVCSETWLGNFLKIEGVAKTLTDLYGRGFIKEVIGAVPEAMKSLGITFGVKGILVGDDAFWDITGKEDAAAVIGLRREGETDALMSAMMQPSYGIAPTFIPFDGATTEKPFKVDTSWDTDKKRNVVDAECECDLKEVNAEGCVLVKLPEVNVSAPTT